MALSQKCVLALGWTLTTWWTRLLIGFIAITLEQAFWKWPFWLEIPVLALIFIVLDKIGNSLLLSAKIDHV